jgi:UDP-glucose 4-epimerase
MRNVPLDQVSGQRITGLAGSQYRAGTIQLHAMAILLCGGTGYVGSHAAVALLEAGRRVVLFDDLSNSEASVADRIAQIAGREAILEIGDVRDTDRVAAVLRRHACTAVVHFAGLKSVPESVRSPLAYFDCNVGGTLSVLRAMQAEGVRSFLFSSSGSVYGEGAALPCVEGQECRPLSPYARTKLQVETVLRDLVASDPAWRVACLRYFNPVGAHASGLLGGYAAGGSEGLMGAIGEVAAGRRVELDVFGNDYPTRDGTCIRDYVDVMDIAEGHIAALTYTEAQGGFEIFNLGTGTGRSVLEVLAAFRKAMGVEISCRFAPRRPGDVAANYASAEKALRMLGWQPRRSLEDTFRAHASPNGRPAGEEITAATPHAGSR